MEIELDQTSPFIQCTSEQDPASLVLLQHPQRMIQLIYHSPEETMFIYLNGHLSKEQLKSIYEVQTQFQSAIFVKEKVIDLKKDIQENRTTKNLVVICTFETYDQVCDLRALHSQIKIIICYSFKDQGQQQVIQTIGPNKLLQVLREIKIKKTEEKTLRSFLFLMTDKNNEVQVSNRMMKLVSSMLSKKVGRITQTKIINELQKVLQLLEQNDPLLKNKQQLRKLFVHELKNGMTPQRCFQWYTMQSVVYKLVNNLLRVTRSPAQVFYILPYFRILFKGIRERFKKGVELKDKSVNEKVFRGGRISEQQVNLFLEGKGKIVQNLIFLSTSAKKQKAQQFCQNVIYQIQIDYSTVDPQSNGYIDMSNFSEYKQSEVLFNPFNYFMIKSVIFKQSLWVISLRYDSVPDQKKSQSEALKIFEMIKRWQADTLQQEVFQGQCFRINCRILVGYEQYWRKFLAIAQLMVNKDSNGNKDSNVDKDSNKELLLLKALGLQQLAFYYQFNCLFEKGIKLHRKCYQIRKQILGEEDSLLVRSMHFLAEYHKIKGENELSIAYYQKCLRIVQKENNADSLLKILNCLQFMYRKIGSHEKMNITTARITTISDQFQKDFSASLSAKTIDSYIEKKKKKLNNVYFHSSKIFQEMTDDEAKDWLENNKKIFGQLSQQYLFCLGKLSDLYRKNMKLQQEYKINEISMNISLTLYGQFHPFYLQHLNRMLRSCCIRRQMRRAIEIKQSFIKAILKLYGEMDPRYTIQLLDLGTLYQKANLKQEAFEIYKKCLKIQDKSGKKQTKTYFTTLLYLGIFYVAKGKIEQGIKMEERSLNICQSLVGQSSTQYMKILAYLSNSYLVQGDMKKVGCILQKCKKAFGRNFTKQAHQRVFLFLYNFGTLYEIKNQHRTSFKYFFQSFVMSKASPGKASSNYYLSLLRCAKSNILRQKNGLAGAFIRSLINMHIETISQQNGQSLVDFQELLRTIQSQEKYLRVSTTLPFYGALLRFQLNENPKKNLGRIMRVSQKMAKVYIQSGRIKHALVLISYSYKLQKKYRESLNHFELCFFKLLKFIYENRETLLIKSKIRWQIKGCFSQLKEFLSGHYYYTGCINILMMHFSNLYNKISQLKENYEYIKDQIEQKGKVKCKKYWRSLENEKKMKRRIEKSYMRQNRLSLFNYLNVQ